MKQTILLALAFLLVAFTVLLGYVYHWLTGRVEGEYFTRDGVRIHFTDEGPGVPVVLIHGFAVNADLNWRRPGITRELAKHYRVIAMDLRGHGLSDKPHDPDTYGQAMVDDVIALLDHLDIEKAHVVGYSLGGVIALNMAARHADRLITAAPLGAGWEDPEDSAFLDASAKMAEALESGKSIGPVAGALSGDREPPGRFHTFWVKLMTGYFNDRLALAAVLRSMSALAVTEDALKNISVPVLSIVGEYDPLKLGVERMEGKVKDQKIVIIPGADHIRAVNDPLFIESLGAFLAEHSSE